MENEKISFGKFIYINEEIEILIAKKKTWLGQNVIYRNGSGKTYAAIISDVCIEDYYKGEVSLTILIPWGNQTISVAERVPYSESLKNNSWSWPPKIERW